MDNLSLKVFVDMHILVLALIVNVFVDCVKEALPILQSKKGIRLFTFIVALIVGYFGCIVKLECSYPFALTAFVTGVDSIILYDYGGYGILSEIVRGKIKSLVKDVNVEDPYNGDKPK